WGADHHGYVPRVRASLEALGYDPKALEVLILQLVHLKRGGETVSMGKRAGKFVTVRELIDEVGVDAARFFFLTRRADASLDFDLELAKKHSLENPVYHVQYVHARIQSIFRKLSEEDGWKGLFRREEFSEAPRYRIGMGSEAREIRVNPAALAALTMPEELALIRKTHEFFRVVEGAAAPREPHRLTSFLVELASAYHSYYTMGNRDRDLRVVSDDAERSEARVLLSAAVQVVVRRGLGLLGVGAPERM
ncbi:MAG: hypothetical protein KC466_05145, partial [Myxococcales bacterium]|nr:hypothetical protein [Myxococcales bacterium]